MTRNTRRIQLAPAYILHHRPYRDTSRIFEVLTRDHGRLSLFARGVRGPKAKLASILQPFQMLLLSWTGRGEAAQIIPAHEEAVLQQHRLSAPAEDVTGLPREAQHPAVGHAGLEADVVGCHQFFLRPEFSVQAAERGPPVAGNEARRMQTDLVVQALLLKQQA